jgi:acetolactate synthase-1/3 small subunit
VSRLTLVTTGNDAVVAQITSQLGKLVDVVQVDDLTRGVHFERELLLLKIRTTASQLGGLTALVAESNGRILSPALSNFVVEVTSSEAQVSRFIAHASQYGELVEVVRSGALAIAEGAPVAAEAGA